VSPWCDAELTDDPEDMMKGAEPYVAVGEGEKGLVVEGLLLLLRDTLLILPDNMAPQVLNHVVRAEFLLVMANHSDSRVRLAVVKVSSPEFCSLEFKKWKISKSSAQIHDFVLEASSSVIAFKTHLSVLLRLYPCLSLCFQIIKPRLSLSLSLSIYIYIYIYIYTHTHTHTL
jgi:hypothetical protein